MEEEIKERIRDEKEDCGDEHVRRRDKKKNKGGGGDEGKKMEGKKRGTGILRER